MPFVVTAFVGTFRTGDPMPDIAAAIARSGFTVHRTPTIEDLPTTIETIANSGGRIDAVLIVSGVHGPFAPRLSAISIGGVYRAIDRIRNMSEQVCYCRQVCV